MTTKTQITSLPRHVAIIMDGNGRWAMERGEDRSVGHHHGSAVAARIVAEGRRFGIEVMTLYSFSVENWKRPQEEVVFLMELFCTRLAEELPKLMENGIRLLHIGSREGLPARVLDDLDHGIEQTAGNESMTLALAWNYGSRNEITQATRRIVEKVALGEIEKDSITEQTISDHLYTTGLPDPDLLIRTGGEMRLSNFLLWQVSYSEMWVTPTLWPDFTEEELLKALEDYAARKRKFGSVTK